MGCIFRRPNSPYYWAKWRDTDGRIRRGSTRCRDSRGAEAFLRREEGKAAEGVPAESLMVNDATVNRLPPELSEDVKRRFPGLSQRQHFGSEAGRKFLDQLDPSALYQPRRG